MSRQRGTTRATAWAEDGLWVGLVTSLQVPLGVLVVEVAPILWASYPLLLLPLLLTGPLASRQRRLGAALGAMTVAGLISAVVASVSLALATRLLGDWFWGMTSAAGAPPMPPLPRVTLLPTEWMTWAQQSILFLQPPLALVLGSGAWALRPLAERLSPRLARLLPRSLGGRLRLAFGTLIVMTLALGTIGFGMIEEMHIRVHRVQLRADWQRQLSVVRAILDEEQALRSHGPTAAERVKSAEASSRIERREHVEQVFAALGARTQWPGLSARPEDVVGVLELYRPALDRVIAAHAAFREAEEAGAEPGVERALLADATVALGQLQRVVGADTSAVLANSDLTHHQRLIGVMILVASIAGLGLWLGEHVLQTIETPLWALGAQLRRVARGDFSRRVTAGGPDELRELSETFNQMTADLSRLYEAERQGRASAEAMATREQELSAAKEFWTNTLVHDLKNPLTTILGWIEMLEMERRPSGSSGPHARSGEDRDEALQHIRLAASTLEALITDINDTFRLQAAALPVQRTSVRPGELLESAMSEYGGRCRPTPDVHVAAGLAPVTADTRLVGRVLQNLIGNAYKHAGPRAQVAVIAEPAADGVRFAVDDDGPGIPAGERELVFERFMQGTGAAQGSGLGLAFCKLVVEQLGGRIWADSSSLGGTRIAFELPAALSAVSGLSDQDVAPRIAPRVA